MCAQPIDVGATPRGCPNLPVVATPTGQAQGPAPAISENQGRTRDVGTNTGSLSAATEPPASFGRRKDDSSPLLNDIEVIWAQVIEAVKAKEMSTGMFLAESQPVEVTDGQVIIGFPEEFQFHREMLDRAEKRKLIEEIFSERLGDPVRIQFVTTRILKTETPAGPPATPKQTASQLPDIVQKAMDIFQGSKIVRSE